MRKQQRDHQQDILGPLVDADCLHQGLWQGLAVFKAPGNGNLPQTHRQAQAEGGVGGHRLVRVGQQRQVGAGVTDVVELAEALLQAGQFLPAGHVGHAVRGQHLGKNSQVSGHTSRQRAIGSGRQIELPALAPLGMQVAEQFGVVGQPGGVERGVTRYLGLQAGASLGQPLRQLPEMDWVAAHKQADGVEERVGFDQRAVQIDTQRQ